MNCNGWLVFATFVITPFFIFFTAVCLVSLWEAIPWRVKHRLFGRDYALYTEGDRVFVGRVITTPNQRKFLALSDGRILPIRKDGSGIEGSNNSFTPLTWTLEKDT